MPDEWEKSKGLNFSNPDDGSVCSLDKKFTNLEVYLNSLVASVSGKNKAL